MSKSTNGLSRRLRVEPGKKFKLSSRDPDDTAHVHGKQQCASILEKNIARLFELQTVLAAGSEYAVLVVLQAMDAGGKDGTIRHVMTGLNPQGCHVTPFKVPSAEEARHDFLWRIHKAVPARGEIGIFNRSHYEDVLVARVHNLVPKSVWSERYEQINAFEKTLHQNQVRILKFFLHISKQEQSRRLEQRVGDPLKNWKISSADFSERRHWDAYVDAYEDALGKCSTDWAPWFVIPANKKWFRNLAVSQIIVEALEEMKLKYPQPPADLPSLALAAKGE
jgi:PPK2 family polyphosphate:nucleotide phosphotransferase